MAQQGCCSCALIIRRHWSSTASTASCSRKAVPGWLGRRVRPRRMDWQGSLYCVLYGEVAKCDQRGDATQGWAAQRTSGTGWAMLAKNNATQQPRVCTVRQASQGHFNEAGLFNGGLSKRITATLWAVLVEKDVTLPPPPLPASRLTPFFALAHPESSLIASNGASLWLKRFRGLKGTHPKPYTFNLGSEPRRCRACNTARMWNLVIDTTGVQIWQKHTMYPADRY